MKDSFSWLTPKQAGELAGYTARHIQNLITSGKLSATKEDGKYYIDKSEFFRLYPDAFKKEQEGNITQQIAEKERLAKEVSSMKDAALQREKEIEFLRKSVESLIKQIEYSSVERGSMMEAILNTTKLLEHRNNKEQIDKQEEKEIKSNSPLSGIKELFRFKK